MFSPQGYPNGKVIYDMTLAATDDHLFSLYDLEPWRQCLAVFALTSYKDMGTEPLSKGLERLRKKFPGAVVYKILVFGVPKSDAVESTKNIIPILSSKVSSNFTSVESAVADITSDFLAELAVFTIAKQMGSFKSPMLKGLESPLPASFSDKPFNVSLRRGISSSGSRSASSTSGSVTVSRTNALVSKTGSISLGLSDRSKSRQRGRTLKFLGNMYLLAGRLSDALRELTEAASILKSTFDHLWFASCLENIGVCLVLLAFLEAPIIIPPIAMTAVQGGHIHHESTPSLVLSADSSPSSRVGSPIEVSSTSSLHSQPALQDFLPQLTDAVSRYYGRSQLNSEETVPQLMYCESLLRFAKLQAMIRLCGGWNGALLSAVVRETPITPNITSESPSAASVAQWCSKVYHTELSCLPIISQCQIYSGLASIYSMMNLVRKRNFMLRELLLALDPKQSESKELATAALINLDNSFPSGLVGLLDDICKVYGAGDVTAIGCGWITLKNSFLRTCISLCNSLSDYAGVIYFCTVLLSTSADMLSKEEQLRLHGMMHNAMDAARRSGKGSLVAGHWDPYMLRDITLLPLTVTPPSLETITHTTDVFLYNPYKREPLSDSKFLVQNERAELVVKLQNPFEFEMHVSELALISEDSTIEGSVSNVYIPPLSIQEVIVPVIPKKVGSVQVTGCRIRILGCEPREFLLSDNNVPRMEMKTKHVGVNAGSAMRKQLEQLFVKRPLEFDVIPAQPQLAIDSTSWDQGWIMLLEGEKQLIRFSLSNFSDVQVNTLKFSFSDSTSELLQAALTNRELPLNEVYECEYFLFKRRTMHLLTTTQKIESKSCQEFEVELLGKRGMTNASIHIDYSSSKERRSIWTRRVNISIQTTVGSSIQLGGCDIISLPDTLEDSEYIGGPLKSFLDHLSAAERAEYFLLVLDLRNAWNQELDVTIWSLDGSAHSVELGGSILPSRNRRFLLPFKWPGVNFDNASKPIPKLGQRQFVVDSNMSSHQVQQMREAFWYREKLLECLGGMWTQPGGKRTGFIEFRGIRLTPRMVNLLRTPQIGLHMNVLSVNGDDPNQLSDHQWSVRVEDEGSFLRTTITNGSKLPLRGVLRLIPSVLNNDGEDIEKKLLYNGLLQQQIPTISPGDKHEVDLGFISIAKENFIWTSQFETVEGEQYFQKRPIYIKAL